MPTAPTHPSEDVVLGGEEMGDQSPWGWTVQRAAGLEEVLHWGPPERVPGRRQWQCPVTGPGTQGSLDQLSWFARRPPRS